MSWSTVMLWGNRRGAVRRVLYWVLRNRVLLDDATLIERVQICGAQYLCARRATLS